VRSAAAGPTGTFPGVLHVVTIHYRSDAWIAPQLRDLERFAPPDTRVWACLNGIDGPPDPRFHFTADLDGTHPQKLNRLAEIVAADAATGDHLLFLDGDALPVAPLAPLLVDPAPLIAVRRDENFGDPQPHPCFCLTTVGFWRRIEGDWRPGPRWRNRQGVMVTDPGARLMRTLDEQGIAWRPLLRVNTVDPHPIWFALYGDAELGPVVYHHGAGFRGRVSRVETLAGGFAHEAQPRARVPAWLPGADRIERRRRSRRIARRRRAWERAELPRQTALADELYRAVQAGDDLVARLAR
jgi:hypothetical protein